MAHSQAAKALVVALLSVLPVAGVADARAGGVVDRTFGSKGFAVLDFPGSDFASNVAVQSDGKVVLAGFVGPAIGVVRLTPAGRPDRTFSGDGRTTIPIGSYAGPIGIGLNRDGSIIIGAYVDSARRYADDETVDVLGQIVLDGYRLALVKLRKNGTLDPTFGDAGIAFSQPDMVRPMDDAGANLAMAPDGKIVLLGIRGFSLGFYGYPSSAVLMRFTPQGRLDESFGVGGIAPVSYVGPLPYVAGLAVQPDGRILVGSTVVESAFAGFAITAIDGSDYVVSRVLASGQLALRSGPVASHGPT
jgi:uncharacterized delta-60 repeat protein